MPSLFLPEQNEQQSTNSTNFAITITTFKTITMSTVLNEKSINKKLNPYACEFIPQQRKNNLRS